MDTEVRFKEGDEVILDKSRTNGSIVIVVTPRKYFTKVKDSEGSEWEVMTCRLSPIIKKD